MSRWFGVSIPVFTVTVFNFADTCFYMAVDLLDCFNQRDHFSSFIQLIPLFYLSCFSVHHQLCQHAVRSGGIWPPIPYTVADYGCHMLQISASHFSQWHNKASLPKATTGASKYITAKSLFISKVTCSWALLNAYNGSTLACTKSRSPAQFALYCALDLIRVAYKAWKPIFCFLLEISSFGILIVKNPAKWTCFSS